LAGFIHRKNVRGEICCYYIYHGKELKAMVTALNNPNAYNDAVKLLDFPQLYPCCVEEYETIKKEMGGN